MKEITDKLAHELLPLLTWIEEFSDKYEKDTTSGKHKLQYGAILQAAFNAKMHLLHHMQDMISHPDFVSQPQQER